MEVKFIEAGQTKRGPNHGKFGIFRFTNEWSIPSAVPLPEGQIKPLSLLPGSFSFRKLGRFAYNLTS